MAFYNQGPKAGFNYSGDSSFEGVLEKYKQGTPLTKIGRVCRRLYKSDTSSFAIYLVEDSDNRQFTAVGQFPVPLVLDGHYEFSGIVKKGKKGDNQLEVEKCHATEPGSEDEVMSALLSIPGVDIYAPAIFERFGSKSIETIKTAPEQVSAQISGLSVQKVRKWQKFLQSNDAVEAGAQRLLEIGLNQRQVGLLLEKYGPLVLDRIEDDPYFLLQELPNFSFKKCDTLALKNGAKIDSISRLTQAMVYTMKKEVFRSGVCYMAKEDLLEQTRRLACLSLEAPMAEKMVQAGKEQVRVAIGTNRAILNRADIQTALDNWDHREPFYFPVFDIDINTINEVFETCQNIFTEDDYGNVYLNKYYEAEERIGRNIANIMAYQGRPYLHVQEVIDDVCAREHVVLEEKQMEAVQQICAAPGGVYILTGSAGCGKTFTLNIVIKVLQQLSRSPYDFSAKILAPTGKAAKVAGKATGLSAMTIHMAIGYTQDEEHTKDIKGDVVVIDEFSMVDLMLASELFAAVSPASKVIILGDTKQLPSIGPGSVLADLIRADVIPTTELTVIKRQNEQSGILENANNIIHGNPIRTITKGEENHSGDAVVEETAPTADDVLSHVNNLLEWYPLDDIQVLCPLHKGPVGTDMLNYQLQQEFNPGPDGPVSKQIGDISLCFREGDKVIHTKNNYGMVWYQRMGDQYIEDYGHTGIINGETGYIAKITTNGDKSEIIVCYDDGFVKYQDDYSELEHAYAMTIHKSQGSQWPAVVCPLGDSSAHMMNKKLLYTMYTRAQETNVVIGTKKTLKTGEKEAGKAISLHMVESVIKNVKSSR